MKDLLDEIAKAAPKKQQRASRADVTTGLGHPLELRDKIHEAAETGKSKKHGKFIQFTMRLDETAVDGIKKWADEFGLPRDRKSVV